MDSSLSTKRWMQDTAPAISSISLLERGLACAQEGNYSEAALLLKLAREQLLPDQMQLASAVDVCLQSYTDYQQAQQALFLASKHFVAAEAEQQNQFLALGKMLSPLQKETVRLQQFPTIIQPAKNSLVNELQVSASNSNGRHAVVTPQWVSKEDTVLPPLFVICFGHFEVKRFNQTVVLCQNRNGQAILRYLVAQVGYSASIDSLMEVVWPEDAPEVARRKLQIAVSAARCSLNRNYPCPPGGGYILCRDQTYQLNTAVTIQTDVDEFLALWKAGRQSETNEALAMYEKACNLYTGPFLVEDMYADWSFIRREQLSKIYLSMCHILANFYLEAGRYEDATKWVNTILKEDRCDEVAHRQLIRIYAAEGRRSEALRQYYLCESLLARDLGVQPMPETVNVLGSLLNGEHLPEHRARIEGK